jgi:hypothetical protein
VADTDSDSALGLEQSPRYRQRARSNNVKQKMTTSPPRRQDYRDESLLFFSPSIDRAERKRKKDECHCR